MPLFLPILAGATLRDRLFACLGATIGIALTGIVAASLLHPGAAWPLIVAPMGASAVLVFAVPASPLAQPWPVIGGNLISALVGITVARLVPVPALAAALAVGGAILAVSLTRSLHPPGGAVALSTVVGGPAVLAAGYGYAFAPVALNAALMALCGIGFHRLGRHSYPHRPAPLPLPPFAPPHADDLDRAIAEMGETFDVAREDLDQLIARVARIAAERRA